MSEVNGQVQIKGDYGNPSGTGIAGLELYGLTDEAHDSAKAKLAAYHAALVTAQLTETVACDIGVNYLDPDYKVKPGVNCNIDRKIVCTWRKKTESAVRRHTISGVPTTSTAITLTDAGERINDVGRAALASALEAAYGLTPGDVIVLTGTVLQPK